MKDAELIKQLKIPTHINYISSYITKQDMKSTKEQIQRLLDQKLIQESAFKDYFVDSETIMAKNV